MFIIKSVCVQNERGKNMNKLQIAKIILLTLSYGFSALISLIGFICLFFADNIASCVSFELFTCIGLLIIITINTIKK